jgi:hypothetical protein
VRIPTITIQDLMKIILAVGLVLVVVRIETGLMSSPIAGLANLASYLVVLFLVMATYMARHRKGKAAEWWFGCALCGWAYYLFSSDMYWHWTYAVHHDGGPDSLLHRLPHWIIEQAFPFSPDPQTNSYLLRIAQSLLVLFVAVAGGLACLGLASQRRAQSADGSQEAAQLDER